MYSGVPIVLISLVLEQIVLHIPNLGMAQPGLLDGSAWDEELSSFCKATHTSTSISNYESFLFTHVCNHIWFVVLTAISWRHLVQRTNSNSVINYHRSIKHKVSQGEGTLHIFVRTLDSAVQPFPNSKNEVTTYEKCGLNYVCLE